MKRMPFSSFISAFIFFTLMIWAKPQFAQSTSPYTINWAYDAPILGGAMGTFFAARIKQKNTRGLTELEIKALDPNDVWSFDRNVIGYHSDIADDWSDALLGSSYLASIGLMTSNKRIRKNWLPALVVSLQSYYLNRALNGWIKVGVLRIRPLVYDSEVPLEQKTQRYDRFSFFSGHTSFTSVLYFSSAKIFADHFPESRLKPFVWGFAAVVPAATGFLRTRAGKHFYTDVITGYISGALFGILVPHFHKQKLNKNTSTKTTSFKIYPGTEGVYCFLNF